MSEMVSPLLQWLNANPEWAGVATFLISAAESVAIIGTIVPGSITMTAIGTLAGAGVIPLWQTIIWAILGAILGDGISYWMGYYFKDRIKNMWPFRTNPGVLDKGEIFVHKYGVMSVFIGRFVGPVRALVPLVAGMLGMKPWYFTIANVTSAIGWAPAYMLPGILLGAASLELPPDIAIHVILVLFIFILFIILCFWTIYKLLLYVSNQMNYLQTELWLRLQKSKVLSPTTVLLKHYDATKTYGQFSLALLFVLSAACFSLLIFYIKLVGAPNILINDGTFHFFRGLNPGNETLDNIMIAITLFGQKQVVLPVIIVLGLWLLAIKRFRVAFHVLLLGLLTAGSVFCIKHLVKIPRPPGLAAPLESYSFPSGHTALTVTIYIGITLLLVHSLNPKKRLRFYILPFLIAVGVSISRLYLGVHWFTDVFGSWLLSIAILSLIAISYQRKREKALNPWHLLLISSITILLSFTYYYTTHIHFLKNAH